MTKTSRKRIIKPNNLRIYKTLCVILAAGTYLSGCAVTTAGVKKGDERNFARSVNDISAARAIKARMQRAEGFKLGGVDVEVAEGIVLLAGNVQTPEDRIEAERIAWSASRIHEVGNEIMIKEKQGTVRNTKDGILNQKVRARLIADKTVKARNFNLEVHDGIVYLLGVARTPQELERAAHIASTTKGTREVISYATIHNDVQSSQNQYASQNYGVSTQSYAPPSAPASLPAQPSYRPLPESLSATPMPAPIAEPQRAADALPDTEPYFRDPQTGERIQLPPGTKPIPFVPAAPGSLGAGAVPPPGFEVGQPLSGPTAPQRLTDMGDQLGKAFPTDNDLGAFRTGSAGEAVSIIESEPYYIDPESGKQIPISYIRQIR